MMLNRRTLMFLAGILLAGLFAGCSAPKTSTERVLWPSPPEVPRLEWIKNYYSEDDFPKTGFQVFLEGFLGKPPLTFFGRPMGVAANGKGLIYVADPDLRVVRYIDLNNYKINQLNNVTGFGKPIGMTVDSRGNLYVVDSKAKAIMVFDAQHKPLYSFGGSKVFVRPAYIALSEKTGRIYVSDGGGSRIVAFDMQGKELFSFGQFGEGDGEFKGAQGLAVDGEGRVFVADQLNARIQVFDADGNFLYKFGERGDKIYHFEGPKDLAFDSEGNLHIVDVRKSALLTYTPDGNLLLYTGSSGPSPIPVAFALPTGIFIDQNDRIYIADSFNMRVNVWQYMNADYRRRNPVK